MYQLHIAYASIHVCNLLALQRGLGELPMMSTVIAGPAELCNMFMRFRHYQQGKDVAAAKQWQDQARATATRSQVGCQVLVVTMAG